MVTEIAQIPFTALTEMDLAQNQIESVEGMPWVEIPQFDVLMKIVEIATKSLQWVRKADWPALYMLNINKK